MQGPFRQRNMPPRSQYAMAHGGVYATSFFGGIFLTFVGFFLTMIGYVGDLGGGGLKVVGPMFLVIGITVCILSCATYRFNKHRTAFAKEAQFGSSLTPVNQTTTTQYVSYDQMGSLAPYPNASQTIPPAATLPVTYSVGEVPYPQNHPYPKAVSTNATQAPYPNISPNDSQPHQTQGAQASENPPSYDQATKDGF